MLPETESRQIYSLCGKTCLNILIWSTISIIPAVQFNVTLFSFHQLIPPPPLYQDLFESSRAFCETSRSIIPRVRTDELITP